MNYIQYIPQSYRKEKENNVHQLHSNNIHQLYKNTTEAIDSHVKLRNIFLPTPELHCFNCHIKEGELDKCTQYIWEDVINAQNTLFEGSERKKIVGRICVPV